jgi:hypothetical protein
MKQAFIYHALAGSESSLIAPGFADVVNVYFVYTASVTIAAAVVIVSLGFAANVAVEFLDRIVKPAFFAAETQGQHCNRITGPGPAPRSPARYWEP